MLSARESGEGPEMKSFLISTDSIFFSLWSKSSVCYKCKLNVSLHHPLSTKSRNWWVVLYSWVVKYSHVIYLLMKFFVFLCCMWWNLVNDLVGLHLHFVKLRIEFMHESVFYIALLDSTCCNWGFGRTIGGWFGAAGRSTGDGDNPSWRPPLDELEPVVKTVGIEVDGTTTLPTGGGGGLIEPPEARNLGLPKKKNTQSGSTRFIFTAVPPELTTDYCSRILISNQFAFASNKRNKGKLKHG